jgi:hypothetical protein
MFTFAMAGIIFMIAMTTMIMQQQLDRNMPIVSITQHTAGTA